nr:hypothetical protein [Tanacetum cinerariifolium]
MIKANPEMQTYIGLDFDPVTHEKASTLSNVDDKLLISGVDGIVMDLGMSSMQEFFQDERSKLLNGFQFV